MVFLRDDEGEFNAPLATVWEFVGSGDEHARAHGHDEVHRSFASDVAGTHSWAQTFRDALARFTMRWRSYHPLGIAYEVLAGPFEGSCFFLWYEARGQRTAVHIVGEFTSPTLTEADVPAAVQEFFAREFEQDARALARRHPERPALDLPSRPRRGPRSGRRTSPRR